ncbi:hypothetical protein GCM10010348_76810 [Streptomyces anthocyanicus]|uniref:hypothetical protein n=1 Tax=Streptomyces anthocyanicus TaxID=68174 RepID=UPI00187603D6|nr:hypothetical protein [Streptomyces anthocyanicus]WTC12557.1 hypothetical protein OHA15_33965 [Streptomyces anthocyanicus]GHC38140.1 hypothetical protein GCM10010348_76810 [Streptomyces anthocyanicus]
MARYMINYRNGMTAPIAATTVEQNVDGSEYRFLDANGRIIAYVIASNVLSIVLVDEPKAVTG